MTAPAPTQGHSPSTSGPGAEIDEQTRPGDSAGGAPLRILHVTEAFGAGVLEVVRALADRLAAAGDTVAVAHGRRPESPTDPSSVFSPAVQLHALPWERRTLGAQVAAARALRAFVRDWQPDVIHLHSSFAGVVGAVALGNAVPSVYTPHGYSFTMRDQSYARRRLYRTIERFTASRVDVVGAVSESEAKGARLVAPANKVLVVRNGIPELDEPERRPPPRELAGRPRVITIGRIDEASQPASTARILSGISDIADVAWVGGGGRGGIPESVVTDQGVPVTGWLEHEEALREIESATACLHWSAWDGQPLSVLEAMAKDVVVIASDIPPTREILGSLQVCGSEDAAGSLLRSVLTNPELRAEFLAGQRGRSANFGASRMALEWRGVYKTITGRRLIVANAGEDSTGTRSIAPKTPNT